MISSNPTPEERVKYEAWLQEAEQALHHLNTGRMVVSITYMGETRTYARAAINELKAYVDTLRKALGRPKAIGGGAIKFRPVTFG